MAETSSQAAPGTEQATDAIEVTLAALMHSVSSPETSLLERLVALQDDASDLLSQYAALVRSPPEKDDALEATKPQFGDLKDAYDQLFASCVVPADKTSIVAWHRKKLLSGKPRYDEAAAKTGVPWWFVGIVHAMEASFNFQGHLHNGDPLTQRTVQVPAGRPPQWNPPSDWVSSAVDALQYEGFVGATDWSVARSLYRWEAYNGWGYYRAKLNTPYLWSFSNHYTKGKFVKDRVYDPDAISKQCGAAVMLKTLLSAGDIAV